ncbi:FecR family protein [Longitalea arenae]|uniref:FecR family protein n=1 Tax=Longitalea arenae TaxID=2812558 RepID=UPI001966D25B|nr:FecR family protein [Longitalea arenae]
MIVVVKRIASLIIKQWRGELTVAESIELEQWASQHAANRELLQQLTTDETLRRELITYYEGEEDREAVWQKIEEATRENTPVYVMPVQPSCKYRYLAAAVTVAALFTAVGYFWFQGRSKPGTPAPVARTTINDVLPGGNKAILQLSDGKTIVLDNAQNGLLAQQGSSNIIKQNDGELIYDRGDGNSGKPFATDHSPLTYNTLATPAGGQFQLKLPDGTRVWLNAASSITYPTAFNGHERSVTITGEGYFEVAKDARRPFKVTIAKNNGTQKTSEVEVLGTHFNINAYDDEAAVKTTLLEGKVKVVHGDWSVVNGKKMVAPAASAILTPGEQAQISHEGLLTVKNHADLEEVVAWKNGEFLFQHADIGTLMRQVARWYDIEVEYPKGKPKDKFSGKIGRNVNLSQLLEILKYSEVRFELKGRTLIVQN